MTLGVYVSDVCLMYGALSKDLAEMLQLIFVRLLIYLIYIPSLSKVKVMLLSEVGMMSRKMKRYRRAGRLGS
jgi:hypothetical protein